MVPLYTRPTHTSHITCTSRAHTAHPHPSADATRMSIPHSRGHAHASPQACNVPAIHSPSDRPVRGLARRRLIKHTTSLGFNRMKLSACLVSHKAARHADRHKVGYHGHRVHRIVRADDAPHCELQLFRHLSARATHVIVAARGDAKRRAANDLDRLTAERPAAPSAESARALPPHDRAVCEQRELVQLLAAQHPAALARRHEHLPASVQQVVLRQHRRGLHLLLGGSGVC
mmetsp:Transcript_51844/g.119197  ORF Transcript_51844/g.119197 Transcript_51844/m.119197 type:complete len:231 (+) Transcript_51844:329-1021(+)